jgi:DNA polymerase II small subunit
VNLIIKESSFIPSFNGHLTEEILQKISDQEIQRVLKRYSTSKSGSQSEKELSKEVAKDNNLMNSNKSVEVIGTHSESLILTETENDAIIKLPSQEKLYQNNLKSKDIPELPEKKESIIIPSESGKSSLEFKPIAKEYSEDYEILKDPTGKIYTNGDYNDFYELTLDKYNQLYKMMKRRGDAHSATAINTILRNTMNQEVATIGLIKEIRKTKNGNYFLTLEDNSAMIDVLVKSDLEDPDTVKIIDKTIMDQMLLVKGTYAPTQKEKRKKSIIYASSISKIDIPRDHEPTKSQEPLFVALISDAHIGSKEFMLEIWQRFISFLNGEIGNKNVRELAGKIKYIIINGDLVDGIGVYPTQHEDLVIKDIYQQYDKAYELVSKIPDYIKVFYSSGNHEPVRNAIPRPAVPKKYAGALMDNGIKCIGNPAVIKTHNVTSLIYHGDSLIDLNQMIPGLKNEAPVETMKELLICRHLAPIFGKKTQIAPINKDWLVIDSIPDIFHTGHIHINGMGSYRNIALVNSGCFQSRTEFMKSFGIEPTPGIVSLVDLNKLKGCEINLIKGI